MIRKFIAVDDNEFNNVLCRMTIELALGDDTDITCFVKPEAGLAFISEHYMQEQEHTILLLDINMPVMDGWEFMEHFNELPDMVKKQVTVYIVSSSVDPRDIEKAETNEHVKGFLSKPVDVDMIKKLAGASQDQAGAEGQ